MGKKLLVGAMWQLGWSSGEYEQNGCQCMDNSSNL